jgi:hypothetical protein
MLSSSKHSLTFSAPNAAVNRIGAADLEAGVNPVIVDEPIIRESARRQKR